MFSPHSCLRPNEEEAAAKVMDGEAIIINLSNGIYYSMDKIRGMIWEMIEGRQTLEEMVATICARYNVSAKQAQAVVERLTTELVQEQLVLEADDEAPSKENQIQWPEMQELYEPPKLNIYRDMGDLLALDPPTPGLEVTPWKEPGEESPD